MTVLILARDLDSQVDRLVQALDERDVPVFRTDLAAFPRALTLDARCGLGGVLSELDVLWVNHPSRESDAIKPRQLNVARKVGLGYPASQVTNKPDGVRHFAATCSLPPFTPTPMRPGWTGGSTTTTSITRWSSRPRRSPLGCSRS